MFFFLSKIAVYALAMIMPYFIILLINIYLIIINAQNHIKYQTDLVKFMPLCQVNKTQSLAVFIFLL